jgi:hypothetical protein
MALNLLIMTAIAQLCGLIILGLQIPPHSNMNGLCMLSPPLFSYSLSWYVFHEGFSIMVLTEYLIGFLDSPYTQVPGRTQCIDAAELASEGGVRHL